MTELVEDARPEALVRVLNPVMRAALRTPLARIIRPFALLELEGRRTGRALRIPVGIHDGDGGVPAIVTPAPWRANFAGGWPATLHHRGRTRPVTGVLVTDPDVVANRLRSLFAAGTSPRDLGLRVPAGHALTADDVRTVQRALIELSDRP